MAADRKLVATGARVATGVVVAAVAAAVAGAAFVLPLPSVTAEPASVTVDPAPAEEVRACAGPLVRLSDDTGQDATAISGVGTPQLVSGSSSPDAALDISGLTSSDDRAATEASAPSRVALPAQAAGAAGTADDTAASVLFGAAQSQSVATGELSGFAASACGEATSDSWLVAGATTVGRTSFVVLANPGDVAAVVDLAIYGDQGAVVSPGANNIDVPARSTRILSLAGLAPSLTDPVVHVTASVGAVSAFVQQSVVRGLEAGGVEQAGPTAGPASEQTIAGIRIAGTSAIARRLADPDYVDLQSILRLFVPGDAPASVTIRIAEEKTGGAQTEYQVGLTPGIVTEFPLQDIPDGVYSVQISSDQPLVASARTSTLTEAGSDFAWYPALPELGDEFFVATADGPAPRLHLVNASGADAQITLTTASGTQSPVTIVPGTRYVPLDPTTTYTVSTSVPMAASVSYFGDAQASSFAVSPPSPAAAPVVVYP